MAERVSIRLNGEVREIPLSCTVRDLLRSLNLSGDRCAVEQNGRVVPRSTWDTASIGPGDGIEIVTLVGGG